MQQTNQEHLNRPHSTQTVCDKTRFAHGDEIPEKFHQSLNSFCSTALQHYIAIKRVSRNNSPVNSC